jgi:hypothetical protein
MTWDDKGVEVLIEAQIEEHLRGERYRVGQGPAGKVLLGSDFPNIPYPYAEQVAGLVRLGLGEPWLRAVCWENAAHLFALRAQSS